MIVTEPQASPMSAAARRSGTRLVAILAGALLAAILVAACGDRTTSPAAGTFTPRVRGVLTVVTSDIPIAGFWSGTANHVTGGFEYELARDMAERFGLRSVHIRLERFDRIVAGKLDGADLALDLITPTAWRERRLDFSSAYLSAPPTVVARTGTAVPDLAAARALRWGAVHGTTLLGTVKSMIAPSRPVQVFTSTSRMLDALEAGRIDAALLDLPLAVAIARHSRGKLHAAAQLASAETIAAALPKGSGNVQAVDSALRAFTADGTIDALLRRWVGASAASAETSIPLLRSGR